MDEWLYHVHMKASHVWAEQVIAIEFCLFRRDDLSYPQCLLLANIFQQCAAALRAWFLQLFHSSQLWRLWYLSKLYLDERHLDWMSDSVLQHVLADLRPLWEHLLLYRFSAYSIIAESSPNCKPKLMLDRVVWQIQRKGLWMSSEAVSAPCAYFSSEWFIDSTGCRLLPICLFPW